MRGHSRLSPGRGAIAPAALILSLSMILTAGPAPAQERPAGEPLRQQVEARFEVLPLSDGLLLRPKREMNGARAIEVRDGELAVDGRAVDADDLEARIGADAAAPVRALLALDGGEMHELFGFGEPDAEPSAMPPAPPVPGIPPPPPLPPGIPDDVRDRLEDQLARQRERVERQQEELRERLADELERRAEEMRDREEDLQRELERVHRGGRSQEARVVVGTPVRVHEGETAGDVVALGGGLTVDGEVSGDAVSIGGPARIRGLVTGGVVAVGGGVWLGPDAEVMGDVVSVGAPLEREPGAKVHGEVTEVSLWQGLAGGWAGGWGSGWGNGWGLGPFGGRHDYFEGALGRLLRTTVSILVLVLLGLLVAAIGRTPLERVSDRITVEPWKAGLVGMLAIVLFIPLVVMVTVLLAISIVGIPLLLLVPFALLACVFLAFFGYLGAAHALGRWSERRFGWRVPSTAKALVLGLFLLHLWSLTARIIDVVDSSHDFGGFLGVMLWLFWMLLQLLAVSMGIGAVLLGRRSGPAPLAAAAPPPPPPAGHPLTSTGTAIVAASAAGGAAAGAANLRSTEPRAEPDPGSWTDERWEEEVRSPSARADVGSAEPGDWFDSPVGEGEGASGDAEAGVDPDASVDPDSTPDTDRSRT